MRPSVPPSAALISVGVGPRLADATPQNWREIGRVLGQIGVDVVRAVSVPGDAAAIAGALREAEADLCVVVGGFGPGTHDLTSTALAEIHGLTPVRGREAEAIVGAWERRRGVAIDGASAWTASVPAGAAIFGGDLLGVPGYAVAVAERLVIVLPDAPAAVRAMLDELRERVTARWPGGGRRRTYRVMGPTPEEARALAEAGLRALASADALAGAAAIPVSISSEGPEVLVRLDLGAQEADAAAIAAVDAAILGSFGPALHGIGEADLARRVVAALIEHGLRIASAESCTGGRVAARITAIAGASACIHAAIVAYDNDIKEAALAVPAAILREHGAVSEPVARAMAAGVRRAFPGHVDVGVGITGIAGPGGGSAAKPVGTVDFAVDDADGSRYRRLRLDGDRPAIQEAAALWALRLVWERLRERGLCGPALLD